jgi:hypothetical protein
VHGYTLSWVYACLQMAKDGSWAKPHVDLSFTNHHCCAGQPVASGSSVDEEDDEWRGGALSSMHGPLPAVTGAPPAAAPYLSSLPRSTAGEHMDLQQTIIHAPQHLACCGMQSKSEQVADASCDSANHISMPVVHVCPSGAEALLSRSMPLAANGSSGSSSSSTSSASTGTPTKAGGRPSGAAGGSGVLRDRFRVPTEAHLLAAASPWLLSSLKVMVHTFALLPGQTCTSQGLLTASH